MARPKNAVFICDCGGWRPVSYHDVPPEIFGGRFWARSLPLCRALTVAQEFNKAHMPCKGTFEGKWAIVIKGLKRQHPAARGGQLSDRAKGGD